MSSTLLSEMLEESVSLQVDGFHSLMIFFTNFILFFGKLLNLIILIYHNVFTDTSQPLPYYYTDYSNFMTAMENIYIYIIILYIQYS